MPGALTKLRRVLMTQTKLTEKDDLNLIAVLDEAVHTAAKHNLSECELISRLLERFELATDNCRSSIHLSESQTKKIFDSKAGP